MYTKVRAGGGAGDFAGEPGAKQLAEAAEAGRAAGGRGRGGGGGGAVDHQGQCRVAACQPAPRGPQVRLECLRYHA